MMCLCNRTQAAYLDRATGNKMKNPVIAVELKAEADRMARDEAYDKAQIAAGNPTHEINTTEKIVGAHDKAMFELGLPTYEDVLDINEQLAASLQQALRYIEVSVAYKGSMTAAEVEAAIKQNASISKTGIGANSCCTLVEFDFVKARTILSKSGAA